MVFALFPWMMVRLWLPCELPRVNHAALASLIRFFCDDNSSMQLQSTIDGGTGGGWIIFSIFQVHFFLSIEFHCTFSIFYKILTYYVYYCCIFDYDI